VTRGQPLFAYVFAGAIAVPGGSYREYLLAGILVQTVVFGLIGPATSIATDLGEGVVDRFRSPATSRAAYLLGHVTAELLGLALAIAILSATGLVVGWRIHRGVVAGMGAYLVIALLAVTMVWIGTLLGLLVRSADSVIGVAFIVVFPLVFLSSTLVPLGGLSPPLAHIAAWIPVTALTAALRELFGNPTAPASVSSWPLDHPVAAAVIWCLVALAVVVPLTLRRFDRRTTG
jgi:ABC transporter DrrB family efflux protein